MCILQIHTLCDDRFFEVSSNEKENAELMVEDMMCQVLLDLFDGGSVDEVNIRFSAMRHCTISIRAQCTCKGFSLHPYSQEHMKRAVAERISSILRELFVTVQIDNIVLRPSQEECVYDTPLSYRN